MANYAFGIRPIPDVEDGHTFTRDNFTQLVPHTKILEGKTGLRFVNCNLTNCDLPADAITEGCGPRHISFCTNEHPKFIDYGLTACTQNCAHVVQVDNITIDGVVVDTNYVYSDKVAL